MEMVNDNRFVSRRTFVVLYIVVVVTISLVVQLAALWLGWAG